MSSIGHYPPQRGRYSVVDFQTGKTLYDTDSLQQAKLYVLQELTDYLDVDIVDSETHEYHYFDGSVWHSDPFSQYTQNARRLWGW